jgi:hypothetical protein
VPDDLGQRTACHLLPSDYVFHAQSQLAQRARARAKPATSMIYKSYVIDVGEREPARWIARISRFDGKIIQAGHGWQNAFYDTIATTTADDAMKYAKAAIDGELIK